MLWKVVCVCELCVSDTMHMNVYEGEADHVSTATVDQDMWKIAYVWNTESQN